MKVSVRLMILVLFAGLIASCSSGPSKTIKNLKTAYNGESTAKAKYAAFAEKAEAEGFDTVAILFRATSKAEAVHAANHRRALDNLGVPAEDPEIGQFEILSTAENLASAIKGETYEIEEMYPGFITIAEQENIADAIESFTYAIETEKKHKEFYENAIAVVNGGIETGLPAKWFVCPVCGNVYDEATLTDECELCMTPKAAYFIF